MSGDGSTGDPVADLLVEGRAQTIAEAEDLYIDEHLEDLVSLVESSLPDAELRRHPLVALLLARGSRRWEDSLV
jgi:hypothetical protein